jgi:hypothetical protein
VAIEVLIKSILGGRPLDARQWIADAKRSGVRFDLMPKPQLCDSVELALAAGITELLASREHQSAPSWTREIGKLAEPFYIGKLAQMVATAPSPFGGATYSLRRIFCRSSRRGRTRRHLRHVLAAQDKG